VLDLAWLRDVLGTLRMTLVRIREGSTNPEIRAAITLVDAMVLMLEEKKEEGNGQQNDRGSKELQVDNAGKEI
jgi:hypothetical protein